MPDPNQTNPFYPEWLTQAESGAFVVDADKAYPIVLAALADEFERANRAAVDAGQPEPLPGFNRGSPTQYDLECAYQCIKLKVQDVVSFAGTDPRPEKSLVISIESKNKDQWAQANFPEGRGAEAASRGLEAKQHYDRVRGKIR